MKTNDWRRRLHCGDEVTWNDPDHGICSKTGIISEIKYKEDDSAWIMFADGTELEVFLKELS